VAIYTGTAGPDSTLGTSGDDTISGLGGADTLAGGLGHNQINGGDDPDTITSTGSDTVDGGAGADQWIGAYGAATSAISFSYDGMLGTGGVAGTTQLQNIELFDLTTGFGNDTFNISNVSGSYREDGISGGSGFDSLTVNNYQLPLKDPLSQYDQYVSIYTSLGSIFGHLGGGSGGGLSFGGLESVDITLSGKNNSAQISSLDYFSGLSVSLDGGSGIDRLQLDIRDGHATFDASQSVVHSNYPNIRIANFEEYDITSGYIGDNIKLGTGSDYVNAIYGGDTIDGGGGSDTLAGGTIASRLLGGSGKDQITSQGADTVDGGDGDDSWAGNYFTSLTNINFTFDGATHTGGISGGVALRNIEHAAIVTGYGNDTVTITNMPAPPADSRFDGSSGVNSLTITGLRPPTGQSIDVEKNGREISGHLGLNAIFFHFENVDLGLGSGNDLVGLKLDSLIPGGNLTLDGGEGVDTLLVDFTSIDVATLNTTGAFTSNVPNLTVVNFENYFIITGNSGGANISLGSGDDRVLAGNGNDTIEGGPGANSLEGGGGYDTLSYIHADGGVRVDLTVTAAQETGGAGVDKLKGFENLTGSAFDDRLTGDALANIILGGDGADTIEGGGGDDTLDGGAGVNLLSYEHAGNSVTVSLDISAAQHTGGAGTDTASNFQRMIGSAYADKLTGASLADTLEGGGGADTIDGGGGNDSLDGGDGLDTASYASAAQAVTVSLALQGAQDTGGAGVDTLKGFENLTGSAYGDRLVGDSFDNLILGGDGNDTVDGGDGSDILDGGAGVNLLSYFNARSGVAVDLTATMSQETGGAGVDTVRNFQRIDGSPYGDTLRTGAGDHTVAAYGGADLVYIDAGASGSYDGGDGLDTLSFAKSTHGVTASLALTLVQATGIGSMSFLNFEAFVGSKYADQLTGSDGANTVEGGSGNDTLDGAGGVDTVSYASATTGITASLALQGGAQNTGSAGVDTLKGFENLTGSLFGDHLIGDGFDNLILGGEGNDTIEGGGGNDILDGAGGVDTVSYASATTGVTVSLALATAQNTGGAGVDTLKGFENLTGSAYGDHLVGDGFDNLILGGDGNDTIEGGAGNDTLDGGSGLNLLSYYNAKSGVTVDLTLTSAQNTGGAGVDTVSNFQRINGSAYGDTLRAGAGAHQVAAYGGADLVYIDAGASGAFDGGDGLDTLSFARATQGATASLGLTTTQTTGIGSMAFLNFEAIVGSAYADKLTGGGGNDSLAGGGGADTLAGGAGADVFRYLLATDSTAAAADTITDFQHGIDKIDLTAIRTGASDKYAISTVGTNTRLDIDLHGDGSVDMRILLVGKGVLTSADLVW